MVSFSMPDVVAALDEVGPGPETLAPGTSDPAAPETDPVPQPAAGVQQQCVRPRALVPLSSRCKQARAVAAVLGVPLSVLPGPRIRAAIERGTAQLVARELAARPPPERERSAKPQAADARPIPIYGNGGPGLSNGGCRSSAAAAVGARVHALAVPPLRPPPPFVFPERLPPRSVPQDLVAATPPARPG